MFDRYARVAILNFTCILIIFNLRVVNQLPNMPTVGYKILKLVVKILLF